jgi:hypothetical protein
MKILATLLSIFISTNIFCQLTFESTEIYKDSLGLVVKKYSPHIFKFDTDWDINTNRFIGNNPVKLIIENVETNEKKELYILDVVDITNTSTAFTIDGTNEFDIIDIKVVATFSPYIEDIQFYKGNKSFGFK